MLLSRTSAFNLLQGYSAAVLDVRLEGEQEDTYITEAHFFRTADWGSLRMREEILIYGSSGDQAVGMSGDVLAKLRGVRSRFRQLYILSTSLEEFADVYPFVCNRAKLPPPLKKSPPFLDFVLPHSAVASPDRKDPATPLRYLPAVCFMATRPMRAVSR